MYDTQRLTRVAATICLALLLASCGDGPTDPATRKAGVRAVLGAGITDTVDTQPLQALVVEVRQSGGALAPEGTLVRFEVAPADPSPARIYYMPSMYVCDLSAATCGNGGPFGAPGQLLTETTDAQGRAKVLVRLGPAAGRAVVMLTVPEFGLLDSATYTVLPGAATHIRASIADTAVDIGGTAKIHGFVLDRYDNVRVEQPAFTVGAGSALTLDATTGTVTGRDMGTQWVFLKYNSLIDSTRVGVVPSGRLVVWSSYESAIRLVDLNGSNERTIATGIASDLGAFPSFDPTRQRVTFHDGSLDYGGPPDNVVIADTTGASRRSIGPTNGFSVVVTTRQLADGSVLVAGLSNTDTSHPNYSLWRVTADNTVSFVVALPGLGRTYGGADISHDGTRVAYVATNASFQNELRVLNVSDGSSVLLETGAFSPRWSAQDDRVAYLVVVPSNNGYDPSYNGAVVVINRDGTGRRTFGTASFTPGLAWSPDGTYVVGRSSDGFALRVVRLSDAATVLLRFPYGGGSLHDYWQSDWR